MSLYLKDQKRTIGEASIDSRLVYEALKQADVGDIITYSHLSDLIGQDILNNRHLIASARNMAIRFDNMVFDCVASVGLKRLSDAEIVKNTASRPFSRIRSTVRGAHKHMACIDAGNISNSELVQLNATRSILGVLAHCSKPKAVTTVSQHTNEPLPLAKTLEFFRSLK
jgi:hypothetical protein